ncbi:MAG: CCA tRNA nucleotidyltransferase [Proteobacteria bacterium]|nr:MAG: CCA tRNA nucleotidyltransferase [Pseudomonadota bacterium]
MTSSKTEQNEAYDPRLDQNYQNALKAIKHLEDAGYKARMAGGCVRDRLIGRRPKDYDIATNAKPDDVCTIFKQKNIKTIPTGIDHGTITVLFGGQPVEVTSLRVDVATDGRRAVVAFGESFEEDSLRRDFTINALYEDISGTIYDYHNGQSDLKNQTLRFVGDAETRIREDYLRILRLFRFWARFGFQPAPGTLEAIALEVQGLRKISSERITSELLQTLESDRYQDVIASLINTKTLDVIFETENFPRPSEVALILNRKTEAAIARLAQLFWDLPNSQVKQKAIQRRRLSRIQQDKLTALFEEPLPAVSTDPGEVFEWLDRVEAKLGEGIWTDLLYPAWTLLRPDPRLQSLDETIRTHSLRRLCPIDGQYLIQNLSLAQGPELGALISDIKRGYRRGQWKTNEEALAFARERLKPKA